MFKKLFITMCLSLMLCALFAPITFAGGTVSNDAASIVLADTVSENSDESVMTSSLNENLGIQASGPAQPVTDISLWNVYIGADNNVYVVVDITGYGNRYVTYDGYSSWANLTSIQPIGNPVKTFRETYNCGLAIVGSHSFYIQSKSANLPWNTMSRTYNFTIS
jgi:hypothetical protein